MELRAMGKSKDSTPPPFDLDIPVVPNTPPTVGMVHLSGTTFVTDERSILSAEVDTSDDCAVKKVSVQIDQGDGRGFRRVGKLNDKGKNGDVVAGDGKWSGTAKMQFRNPGAFPLRVLVEDTHRVVTSSDIHMISVTSP